MSFDLLAPHYRWMELILAGEKLQRCRTAFFDQIPAPKTILLLGEGPGRCLIECRRRFPDARITCVDSSGRMLAQARRRLLRSGGDLSRVELIHADALQWKATIPFELVITHFFLDCFRPDQLGRMIPAIAANVTSNGDWLIGDFQVATAGWRRVRSRIILWLMYHFFRVVTRLPAKSLMAPDSYLKDAGFELRSRLEMEWGLLRSDWWRRRKTQPIE